MLQYAKHLILKLYLGLEFSNQVKIQTVLHEMSLCYTLLSFCVYLINSHLYLN